MVFLGHPSRDRLEARDHRSEGGPSKDPIKAGFWGVLGSGFGSGLGVGFGWVLKGLGWFLGVGFGSIFW